MNYRTRIIEARIKEFSQFFKIILLVGARQVGKSSLFAHLFPNARVAVFDPVQDMYGARKDPDNFLHDFGKPLVLDEIQFAPELLPALKRFADLSSQKGQYFLTGSSQVLLLKSVAESLAGRVVIMPVGTMTPHEMYDTFSVESNWFLQYLQHPDTFFKQRFSKINNVPTRLEAMLRGGMPGTIDLPLSALPAYFSSYVQTYIERDVRLLENIEDVALFGKFVGLMGALSGQEINYTQLGRELGIAPKTAQRWLQLLVQTYQWFELPPFHMNAIKRLSQKPKGIIADTGLACYLQRIASPEALASALQGATGGAIFESYCFNMIKGFCSALPMMPNFYHWRTLAGAEVDFIIEYNGTFYPIEVKSTAHITDNDIRGLQSFRQTYPHLNIAKGIVLYGGSECYRVADDIVAVPWNLQ